MLRSMVKSQTVAVEYDLLLTTTSRVAETNQLAS